MFVFVCTTIIGRLNDSVCLAFGVFLSSLIGEMDGKEREREETKSSKKIVLKITMSMTVVEDDAGVISLVIVPTLAPVQEDAMEEESLSSADI